MRFNDEINIVMAFKKYLKKRTVTIKEIENFVDNINPYFYWEQEETSETIKSFLLHWYDEELNGEKFIDPETFEIIRIKR